MRGRKPLVGITCRTNAAKEGVWWPASQGIPTTHIDAIVKGGGIPLIIPVISDLAAVRRLYEMADGILMVGGGDVHPGFYGQKPKYGLDRINIAQDKVELSIASWTVLDEKPFYGICRGLQVINVAFGGTLIQDIPSEIKTDINHDESFQLEEVDRLVHEMRLDPDSRLAKVLGATLIDVNTMHHQAVDKVAPDLRVVGIAEDGVIEALEGRNEQYIVCVQSHPESVAAEDSRWQAAYSDFVSAAYRFGRRQSKTKMLV